MPRRKSRRRTSGTAASGVFHYSTESAEKNTKDKSLTQCTRKRAEMQRNDKGDAMEKREKIEEIVRMLRRLDAGKLRMVYCYVLGML